MNNQLHVIFGAGQIGSRIAKLLLSRGHRVRMVSRGGSATEGAEAAAGDAKDLSFAAHAARGAAVVYDCANPLYQDWRRDLLPLGRGTLHAATAAGAKLVALDSLYMYGAPDGAMTEHSPVRPNSRKGVLRAELAELRLSALRRGDVHVTLGLASDFFGPCLAASWWSDRFFNRVLAGKRGECLGDPDALHSYSYADDVASALVTLGEAEDTDGVWHVPTVPAETTRQLAARLGAALGKPITMAQMSPLLLRAIGVFAPLMRELPELRYQWQMPFVIDDRKFRARFTVEPTPIDAQVATTAAWARAHYRRAGAPA
jgi:nucleoside-diphosphate-sugar epimerase